jgi:hypothetical protein
MLSIQPDAWPLDGEWRQNRLAVTPAATLPRFLHFASGAIAVAALWLALLGWWRAARKIDPPAVATGITRTGLLILLPTVAVATLLGPIFLTMLPLDVRAGLFRATLYAVLWWIGLTAILGQLAFGWLALRFPARPGWLAGLAGCVVVTLIGMLAAREQVRQSFLARPAVGFTLEVWESRVHPQWSSMVLFFVMFGLALMVIAWAIWVSVRATKSAWPDES